MATRVNDEDVRAIVPNNASVCDFTPYITPANLLVTRLAATTCGALLLDTELKEVERWLSAHYASVSNPTLALQSEEFEGAKNVYSRGSVRNATGVLSTQFGQMANQLSGGCLQELDKRKISLDALGGAHYTDLSS